MTEPIVAFTAQYHAPHLSGMTTPEVTDVVNEPTRYRSHPSGVEAEVCADISLRQQVGTTKYGRTVAEAPLDLKQWLQHAYEECLDQAIYLKRAMREIDEIKRLENKVC